MAEIVREYPALYDKSHKGYMQRDTNFNAWNEVAEVLDFVEDGELHNILFRMALFVMITLVMRRGIIIFREEGKALF